MISNQLLLIFGMLLILLFLYNKNKKDIFKEMLIAFIISTLWVCLSGMYDYQDTNFIIFHLNIFPIILWTGGLVILKEIYEAYFKSRDKYWKNILFITIIYLIFLVCLEYIRYNLLGIKISDNYPGLFGLQIIHAPTFGKIFYLIIGPLYIFITDYFKIK